MAATTDSKSIGVTSALVHRLHWVEVGQITVGETAICVARHRNGAVVAGHRVDDGKFQRLALLDPDNTIEAATDPAVLAALRDWVENNPSVP